MVPTRRDDFTNDAPPVDLPQYSPHQKSYIISITLATADTEGRTIWNALICCLCTRDSTRRSVPLRELSWNRLLVGVTVLDHVDHQIGNVGRVATVSSKGGSSGGYRAILDAKTAWRSRF
jgi:hypothetical protein